MLSPRTAERSERFWTAAALCRYRKRERSKSGKRPPRSKTRSRRSETFRILRHDARRRSRGSCYKTGQIIVGRTDFGPISSHTFILLHVHQSTSQECLPSSIRRLISSIFYLLSAFNFQLSAFPLLHLLR